MKVCSSPLFNHYNTHPPNDWVLPSVSSLFSFAINYFAMSRMLRYSCGCFFTYLLIFPLCTLHTFQIKTVHFFTKCLPSVWLKKIFWHIKLLVLMTNKFQKWPIDFEGNGPLALGPFNPSQPMCVSWCVWRG